MASIILSTRKSSRVFASVIYDAMENKYTGDTRADLSMVSLYVVNVFVRLKTDKGPLLSSNVSSGNDGGRAVHTTRGYNGGTDGCCATNGYAINARHCGELCHELRTELRCF